MRLSLWLRAACAALTLAGCSKVETVQAPTEILLRVRNTDDDLLAKMTALRVTLSVRDGSAWSQRPPLEVSSRGLSWPVEIPITPSTTAIASKQIELVVDALAGKKLLAQTRVLANFVRNELRVLEVSLYVCPGHAADEGYLCATQGCEHEACQVCNPAGDCEAVVEKPTVKVPRDAGTEPPPGKQPPDTDARVGDDGGVVDSGGAGTGGSGSHGKDAGPDAAEEPLIPEPTDVAIAELGDPCATDLERACPEHNSLDKLVCTGGVWAANGSCDGDTRCDTQLGTTQGSCQDIATPCLGEKPGAGVCGANALQRCDADLLRYETIDCPANAHCVDDHGSVSCACNDGFHNDGGSCTDDDCMDNTCGKGGTCVDGTGDYTCQCAPGYDGDGTKVCAEIDECSPGATAACGDGATACENTDGSFECTCGGGYSGGGTTACAAINECLGTTVCISGQACVDATPYYGCRGQFPDWTPTDSPSTLTDNQNGTVTDSHTGLVWQQDTGSNMYSWSNAKSHCTNLSLVGTGWRLPTIAELSSLVDYTQYNPVISTSAFPGAVVDYDYWSSTGDIDGSTEVWTVDFSSGGVILRGDSTGQPLFVRCVR